MTSQSYTEEDTIILEEDVNPNYEPTESEIREYAKFLGMDLNKDQDLFYIAREGLKAPLPPNWKACKTSDGLIYYFNFETGDSTWDHPLDEYYRAKYQEAKSLRKVSNLGGSPERKVVRFAASSSVEKPNKQQGSAAQGLSLSKKLERNKSGVLDVIPEYRSPDQGSYESISSSNENQTESNYQTIQYEEPVKFDKSELPRSYKPSEEPRSSAKIEQIENPEKKLEEIEMKRARELQELQERKKFDLEWRRKQEEVKFASELAKRKEAIDRELETEHSDRENLLDAQTVDEIERESRENFIKKRAEILEFFRQQETTRQSARDISEDRIKDMTHQFRMRIREMEDEIERLQQQLRENKSINKSLQRRELAEYIESVEQEKSEIHHAFQMKLKEIERVQEAQLQREFLVFRNRMKEEFELANSSNRKAEALMHAIKENMQREYAQKFEHAIIELEEEFAKNIKSYENIGRQKANASLEHELREIVKTRFNEGDKAIELDRLIYTQTLKRKLIDYHTELRKEHELVRQKLEQEEKTKVEQLTNEINQLNTLIFDAKEVCSIMEKADEEIAKTKQPLQEKTAEKEALISEIAMIQSSLDTLQRQLVKIEKGKAEYQREHESKMKVAKELEILQKKIEEKQKLRSSVTANSSKTDRVLYDRSLSTLSSDDNIELPPEKSSSLSKIKRDPDEVKIPLRERSKPTLDTSWSLKPEPPLTSSRRSKKDSPVSKRVTFRDPDRSSSQGRERERSKEKHANNGLTMSDLEPIDRIERILEIPITPDMLDLHSRVNKLGKQEQSFKQQREFWLQRIREERMDLETAKIKGTKKKERMKDMQVRLQEEHRNYKREYLAYKAAENQEIEMKNNLIGLKEDLNSRIKKYNEELIKIRDLELENRAKEFALSTLEAAVDDAISQKRFDNEYLEKLYRKYKECHLQIIQDEFEDSDSYRKPYSTLRETEESRGRDRLQEINVNQSYNFGDRRSRTRDLRSLSRDDPRSRSVEIDLNDTIKKDYRRNSIRSSVHSSLYQSVGDRSTIRNMMNNDAYFKVYDTLINKYSSK